QRLMAVLAAAKVYQVDHGNFPATLAELVPTYLPSAPPDPFAADGRAVGYQSLGIRAFAYSVFNNGIDDVAAGFAPALSDDDWWNNPDFILMLDLKPPPVN